MTAKELFALSADIERFKKEGINVKGLSQEQVDEFRKLQTATKRSQFVKNFTHLLNSKLGDSFK